MRYFLLITLISLTLSASQPTCYTVQLLSRTNSVKNHKIVTTSVYDKSCKVMEIGKNITVRCGCFDNYKDATVDQKKFVKKFKNSYVATTYKSRFALKKSPSVVALVPVPVPALIPVSTSTSASASVPNVAVEAEKKEQKLEKPLLVVKETQTKEEQQVKKEKKKKHKHKKKHKKKKKKKNKKTDKKKKKFTKKRDNIWFYSRYLDKLKSKRPSKFYGYQYSFGAQLSYDSAYVNEANDDYYKNGWRRVRVNHKGSFLDKTLFYELEYSFTGASSYKDVYLGYQNNIDKLDVWYRIKGGNIKIPFSLEGYTTSKNITFMERALNDAFSENRKIGLELLLSKKINKSRVNLFTALYTNSIDENIDDEIVKNGYSFRTTYAYKFNKRHLLSFGLGFQERDMNGDDLKINQGAEAQFINKKYVSVKIKDVKTLKKFNIESLYINDKYSFQAEYTRSMVDAYNTETELQNYNFYAYYLQGSYFLIGKGKKYKFDTSTIGKIKPKRDGAVEVAARYSYINLTDNTEDKKEDGGTQADITFGLNWYVNNETKIMFNYILAKPDVYKDTIEDSYQGVYQVIEGRVLFSF